MTMRGIEMKDKFESIVSDKLKAMSLLQKVGQMRNDAKPIKKLDIKKYDWWNEALHGVGRAGLATVFPQAIALAAIFDEQLMEDVAGIVSTEARGIYNHAQARGDYSRYKGLTMWTPNINIFRDPRWGRGQETYGEDPYLTSRLGVAFVKGLQGYDKDYLKTAACAKHFAVHSGPESERHTFDAQPSKYDLYDTYLPAFECAVREGKVASVMSAYNAVYGLPCSCSPFLLHDILREKWGFDGYVVSDCGAIKDIVYNHKTYKSPTLAVAKAVEAGCDLECGSMYTSLTLSKMMNKIKMQTINQSVKRLLMTRAKLGMFDDSCPYDSIGYDVVACKEHEDFAITVAEKCVVLLKNDGTLPLDKGEKICVIGHNAKNSQMLLGNYEGTPSSFINAFDGISREIGYEPPYAEGYAFDVKKDKNALLAEALQCAEGVDTIILCVGLDNNLEGEEGAADGYSEDDNALRGDRVTITLPKREIVLIEKLLELNKKIVLLNFSGGAVTFSGNESTLNAIMQCWYTGAKGGEAIARILFGKVSPSGKLPVTFYKKEEDLPDFRDYSMDNRTYRYFRGEAMYPFGFGLTYADIEFENVKCTYDDAALNIDVTLSNPSSIDTEEVVQIYFHFNDISGKTPLWALKKFKRVKVPANQTQNVQLTIDRRDIYYIDDNGDKHPYQGKLDIFVGNSSPHRYAKGVYTSCD